jgi:lipopolysaccharide export system protein LptA
MRISLGFRFLWLLSFGLCLFGLHAQAQPQTGTFHQVNITADEQSFDEEGRTRFTGDVRVAYKDIRIKSNLATLEMNAVGEPDVATFYNRPLAQRLTPPDGEDNLEADTIKFLINDNKMVAEGNAVSYVTSVAANPVTIHSELQEFDNVAKIVKAQGSVKVDYDATKIYSPTATLWVD